MKTLKQFVSWLKEEKKKSFSVQELKTLKDFDSIREFLVASLGMPSSNGLYREVWIIDFDKVIKLTNVRNQNKRELKNTRCMKNYACQVLDFDPEFHWIIQEKAMILDENDFLDELRKNLNHQFYDAAEAKNFLYFSTLKVIHSKEDPSIWFADLLGNQFDQHVFNELFEWLYQSNSWFAGLINALSTCKADASDLHYENWGIRASTGELVILDLGS